MAKTYCKYHPKDLARKYCPHCQINLCSKCIKTDASDNGISICPVCKKQVRDLGMENVITPFWERIPYFFEYPFNADSMIYIIGLSLLSFLSYVPIVGFAIYIAIMFAIFRYGFALLQCTAKGYLTPKETGGGNRLNTNSNMHLTFFAVTILAFILIYITASLLDSYPVLYGLLSLLVLFLPAIVMTVGVTESFLKAINPLVWFVVIKSIGVHYLTLLAFLVILYGGQNSLFYLLMPRVSPYLLLPVYICIMTYFAMVMFLMMGYFIYQYHERLGVTVDIDFEEKNTSRLQTAEDVSNSVLQEVSVLIQEGMFDEAKDRLKRTLERHSMDLKLNEQYHKLLVKTNDKTGLIAHNKRYVQVLIASGQVDQVIEATEEALRLNKNFRPESPSHTMSIAQHAYSIGKHNFALQLLEKFDQFYPSNKRIPKAALLMCKILCEGLNEDAKAKTILQEAINKYPDGEIADEMREYMKFIDSLLGAATT